MRWYAAHVILYVKFKQKQQRRYPIWENIYLIKAASEDEAWAKAEKLGHENSGDADGSFRWGGKPAEWVFAGVRSLILCGYDGSSRPGDGTEITYLELQVESKAALDRLLNGKTAHVEMWTTFRDE